MKLHDPILNVISINPSSEIPSTDILLVLLKSRVNKYQDGEFSNDMLVILSFTEISHSCEIFKEEFTGYNAASPHLFITIPLHSYNLKVFIRCTKFRRAGTTLSGRMHRRTSMFWNSDSFSGQGAGSLAVWGSASSKTAFHASSFFSKWTRIPWKEACVSVTELAACHCFQHQQHQHPSRK
jgi:hypothetical protein